MAIFQDLIKYLKMSYKTIHISTLALAESQLINVFTNVTFSKDEDKEGIESTKKGELVLIKAIFDIKKWDQIREWLSHGKLDFSDMEVNLFRNIDLDAINYYVDGIGEWPSFYLNFHLGSLPTNHLQKVHHSYKKFGYYDIKKFAKHELGIKDAWEPSFIQIIVPCYAKILSDIQINQNGTLNIKIICHKNIKNLVISAEYNYNWNEHEHHKLQVPEPIDLIDEVFINLPTIDFNKVSSIQINLFHEEIGEKIHSIYRLTREIILRSNIIKSPLLSALSVFMPNDELLRVIKNPNVGQKSPKEDTSSIFEKAICKLLSCGGLNSIWLGAYEEIKEGRVLGSADILSYDSKNGTILVVSCKAGVPDKASIDKISNTARIVKEKINEDIIECVPLIFTSEMASAQKEEAKKFGVYINDSSDIENLYNMVKFRSLEISDLKK